ncbi:MAG: DUF192 domain-containing protein [Hyphomonadaceae bacterium]|nr:DUF192 domain-containing protein [Hyphomonadaceae bacterium]
MAASLAAACAQQAQAPAAAATAPAALETVTIETQNGPVRFQVEIADTDETRARGLMFRREMAADHGMLFDFNPPEPASFWMRNTHLSLDIIFIGADGRILNIADNTTPYSDAPIPSRGLARAVLEINAGRAAALGIRAGDRVRHRYFPAH